ncbi:MAG: DNA polymerase Y family protein, partial [Sphingorhabdus sp.]
MNKLTPSYRSGKAQERRHLAVYLPWLPAERLIRTRVAPPDAAFALVEKQKGTMRLVAVSQAAHLMGLNAGLALADARARVPDLAAYDYDGAADTVMLEQLAEACLRYTPKVMLTLPQGLLLDITGCAHLFEKGESELAADLQHRLTGGGYTASLAFSASSDAAMALAIYGLEEGQVARLPVSALRCDPAVHHALRRAGLTHIRDLASRPRTVLASRFGEKVTHQLARLLNEVDSPIIPRRSRPEILCEVRFAEPIGHTESVRDAMAELAVDAIRQLSERGEGARVLEVALYRCDGVVSRLGIETAAPTRDVALIMRLFAERIDALRDPLDPGFGYDQIALHIRAAEPLNADQSDFESSAAKAREELSALLARLATRLGPECVTRWQMLDSHVPEGVFTYLSTLSSPSLPRGGGSCAATDGGAVKVHSQATLAAPPPLRGPPPRDKLGEEFAPTRPLLLLDPPEAVDAIAEVPDGPPYRFRWRGSQHRVAQHEGPERIVMPWWDGRRKEARLTRDYYRVEDDTGHRFWLFRHGLYEEKPDPDWYVHGLFA